MLGSEVGKVAVLEGIGCDVDDDVRPRAGKVASVRGNRFLDALAAEGDDDGEVVAVGAEGLGYKVLELCDVERHWVATVVGQLCADV